MNKSTSSLPNSSFEAWSRSVMLLSDMELFVPTDSSSLIHPFSITTSRQWLVQGELVRFYLIIHPSPLVSPPTTPSTSGPFAEFFNSLTAHVQILDTMNSSSSIVEATSYSSFSSSSSSKPVGSKNQQKQQHEPLFTGGGTATVVGTGQGCNRISQLSLDALQLQPTQQQQINNKTGKKCEILENGDVLMPLEILVNVGRKFLGKELTLSVNLMASLALQLSSDDLLDNVLNPKLSSSGDGGSSINLDSASSNAVSSPSELNDAREIHLAVRVTNALKVKCKRLNIGTSGVMAISVENIHPSSQDITLSDIGLQFLDPSEG